jgi:hypothetical protein
MEVLLSELLVILISVFQSRQTHYIQVFSVCAPAWVHTSVQSYVMYETENLIFLPETSCMSAYLYAYVY